MWHWICSLQSQKQMFGDIFVTAAPTFLAVWKISLSSKSFKRGQVEAWECRVCVCVSTERDAVAFRCILRKRYG